MKKLLLVLLSCCLVSPLLLGDIRAEEKQDLKTTIVRIKGYEGVAPLNLFISPGTVVVWINDYKQASVKVTFPNKKVTLACQSPVNFTLSSEGTFISNPIPYGAVASLCFIEKGAFDYFIERPAPPASFSQREGFRFEGKIIVK